MTPARQPRPRQAAAATRRRTRRAERQPSVDDVVEIWWDVDKTYYRGRLTRRLEADMHFTMLYDDGETEDVNLHNEFWKFADDDEAFRSPPPSSDSDPECDDVVLQKRANGAQSHRDTATAQQPTASRPAQLPNPPNPPNPPKPQVLQAAQFADNFVMRTRKARPESLGKGKAKVKRTHKQGADKSAVAKRTITPDKATPAEPPTASTKPLPTPQLPRSHVAALVDPAPLQNESGPKDVHDAEDKQILANLGKDGSPNKQSLPIRMKLVKTADAKVSHSNGDPVIVLRQSSGLKRKLSPEPSAPSAHLKKQDTKPSAKIEPALDPCSHREDHDVGQKLNTETETNELDKSNPFHALPTGTSRVNSSMSSPTRRRSVRRRIHSLGDENSTDSSSSPNPDIKEGNHVRMENQAEVVVNKDSKKPGTTPGARNHSIPLKVSLKRANLRVMAASKDPVPRSVGNAQVNTDRNQESMINGTRTGEPKQHGVDDKQASISLHRVSQQNSSVQANQASNSNTEIIDSSKKSVSPPRTQNEVLHTQNHEEQRPNNIPRAPNLELISPVSGLPELDTCIDTAFERRLEPIENHLNKLTSEVQQVKSGFDSARQTFHGLEATTESGIKGVKEDLASLNQKVEVMTNRMGDLREDLKTCRTDTQSIKRDVASIISFLRHEAQLRAQRTLVSAEQVAIRNSVRSSAIPESRSAPPRQNGQLAVATHTQPSAPSNPTVLHYAAPAAQRPARNAVEYRQQTAPTVDIAHGIRQRRNTFPVQRPLPTQNTRHVSVQGAQVQPQANPIPGQSNQVQHQRRHNPAQGTPAVSTRQQQIGSQAASYAANYADNRNRTTEAFTYQVMELVARQVTVWLLETPHEHHKVRMSLDTWAKRTSSTTYARIAPRLAMYRSYEHAMSSLAMNLSHGPIDLTWFMSPFENQCMERARRNYNAWDPPPNDEEWMAEMHLLKELAVGFHRTFQGYSHPESTVLEVSVLLTRRVARDYEEAGYRPILTLTNDAQRQQEGQVYNAQPKGTPIGGWRPT